MKKKKAKAKYTKGSPAVNRAAKNKGRNPKGWKNVNKRNSEIDDILNKVFPKGKKG